MRLSMALLVLPVLFLGGVASGSATDTTLSYTLTDLGPGTGHAVNDSGVVVGVAPDAQGYPRATLWSLATQQATDLGIPDSVALDVNDDGVVVGGSSAGGFRWKDGVTTYLGTLPGTYGSVATGVNASGQVVGYCHTYPYAYFYYPQTYRAFLWENGAMIDLGTLGGASSVAAAVNDAGSVVGWSEDPIGVHHAFAWDAVGGMRDLGAASQDSSVASGIDVSGRAVGWSYALDLGGGWSWYTTESVGSSSTAESVGWSAHTTGPCGPGDGCGEFAGLGVAVIFDGGAVIAIGNADSHAYGLRDATADHGVRIVGDDSVGWGSECQSRFASLWEVDAAGQVTGHDLNHLLDAPFAGRLLGASAIDATGRIVASGDLGGVARVFALTPSASPPVRRGPGLYPPAYVTAEAGSESVTLMWGVVCGADGYVVQRGTAPGGPYATIATALTQTWFVDTSAPLGSTYYYVVAGVDGTLVGWPSTEVAATPRPYRPTNLTARAGNGRRRDQVDLAWTASASDGITHHKVFASDSAGQLVVVTVGPATKYTVTGLARRTTYHFWVTAVHAGGQESSNSNYVSVVTSK